MSSSRCSNVRMPSSALVDPFGDGVGRRARMDRSAHEFDEVGAVDVVRRMDVGGAVGVEDEHIARSRECASLGRELDVVHHPEQRAGTADRDGGRAVAVDVDRQRVTSAGDGQRGAGTRGVERSRRWR